MADELICTTPEVRDYYQKIFKGNINVIPNPFNTNKFCNKKLIQERKYDFCYVGRLNQLKNIRKMTETVGNSTMVIAGDGDEKKYFDAVNFKYLGLVKKLIVFGNFRLDLDHNPIN